MQVSASSPTIESGSNQPISTSINVSNPVFSEQASQVLTIHEIAQDNINRPHLQSPRKSFLSSAVDYVKGQSPSAIYVLYLLGTGIPWAVGEGFLAVGQQNPTYYAIGRGLTSFSLFILTGGGIAIGKKMIVETITNEVLAQPSIRHVLAQEEHRLAADNRV